MTDDPNHVDILHIAVKKHMQDRWRTLLQTISSSDEEFGEYFKVPIEAIMMQLFGFTLDILKLPRANAHRYIDFIKNMQEDNFMTTDESGFREMIIKLVGEEHARVKEPYNS
jgi:hypothetical protein